MRITPNLLVACLLLQGWLFTNFTCKYLRQDPAPVASNTLVIYVGSNRFKPSLGDAEWKRRATAATVGGPPVRRRAREPFVHGTVDARDAREWVGDLPLALMSLGFITIWCMTLSAFLFDHVVQDQQVLHMFRPRQNLAHRHVISPMTCQGG